MLYNNLLLPLRDLLWAFFEPFCALEGPASGLADAPLAAVLVGAIFVSSIH